MHSAHPRSRRTAPLGVAALAALALAAAPRPAAAQDLVYTFGGTFDPDVSYNDGLAFDGTNSTDLPPVLDLAALNGGTFTASFTVPAALTPDSQSATHASYLLGPQSSVAFTLYDAAGALVYQGGGPAAETDLDVYDGIVGGKVDQVVLQSFDGPVTGLSVPPTAYGPADRFLIYGFNFSNYSAPGVNHFSGLSLPTDPAVFLGFPERQFNFEVSYADGDYANGVGPFEFFDTNAVYTVTSVRIAPAAVPEPSPAALMSVGLLGVAGLTLRARRRTAAR